MSQTFYDDLPLGDVRITKNGYLVAEPRVARTGVQLYKGVECGRPDLDTVRVYRPPSEVFDVEALSSLTHKPITSEHPSGPITASNWKKHAVGQTGDKGTSIYADFEGGVSG
ncbi:MAG: DUF2213 domain-containing protein [Rhodoplanes sp.]